MSVSTAASLAATYQRAADQMAAQPPLAAPKMRMLDEKSQNFEKSIIK
jgi:hypothetical protein